LKNIREPIVLPVPAITEVAYLLARDVGNEAAGDFIASLAMAELSLETHFRKITYAPQRSSGSMPMLNSTLWML